MPKEIFPFMLSHTHTHTHSMTVISKLQSMKVETIVTHRYLYGGGMEKQAKFNNNTFTNKIRTQDLPRRWAILFFFDCLHCTKYNPVNLAMSFDIRKKLISLLAQQLDSQGRQFFRDLFKFPFVAIM